MSLAIGNGISGLRLMCAGTKLTCVQKRSYCTRWLQMSQLMGWSAAETPGSCRAKTRGIKSRFKECPKFAGGNKDGKRSIQRLRNLILRAPARAGKSREVLFSEGGFPADSQYPRIVSQALWA